MSKDIYIVYETTNLVNGKYYVGVHKIDGRNWYLGSGKILKQAIRKYGRNNFSRETLQYFDNEQSAYDLERTIVNDELIDNSNCYNIVNGGGNPPSHIGTLKSEKTKKRMSVNHADFSGKNNPNYGRCGILHPNKKRWMINGKMFNTAKDAGLFFNISQQSIHHWCKNSKIPLCYCYSPAFS